MRKPLNYGLAIHLTLKDICLESINHRFNLSIRLHSNTRKTTDQRLLSQVEVPHTREGIIVFRNIMSMICIDVADQQSQDHKLAANTVWSALRTSQVRGFSHNSMHNSQTLTILPATLFATG